MQDLAGLLDKICKPGRVLDWTRAKYRAIAITQRSVDQR